MVAVVNAAGGDNKDESLLLACAPAEFCDKDDVDGNDDNDDGDGVDSTTVMITARSCVFVLVVVTDCCAVDDDGDDTMADNDVVVLSLVPEETAVAALDVWVDVEEVDFLNFFRGGWSSLMEDPVAPTRFVSLSILPLFVVDILDFSVLRAIHTQLTGQLLRRTPHAVTVFVCSYQFNDFD